MHIQVLNLSLNTGDRELRRLFSPFGIVTSAEVLRDKFNGRSKCNAMIDMPVDTEARQAILSLHKTTLDGKTISVSEHHTQPEW
ncbi:RNA recognition motif domain-containing protein [Niastella sp. OAS944]|uniref:RNA recognition motif domain-containing protein n=1 Tax=Niastella sp. OAS944 TaxID=2664089 RepID=UPI003497E62D|nr:RNA recognition motif-containing protein [Chitinophagaceae bacterium OAS944]